MCGFWSRCHCELPTLALRLSPGRPPADLRPPVHSPVLSPWSPSRREDLLTLGRGLCAAAAVTEPGRAYPCPRLVRVSVAGYAHVCGLGEQPLLSRAPIFSPTRPGGSHSVRCQALVRPPFPPPGWTLLETKGLHLPSSLSLSVAGDTQCAWVGP